jgi:hypothetical protein
MKTFVTICLLLVMSLLQAQTVSIDNKKIVDGTKVMIDGAWIDAGTHANALTIGLKTFTLKEGESATISNGTATVKVSHPKGAYVATFADGTKRAYSTVTQLRADIKKAFV